jgi:hypothetical protein
MQALDNFISPIPGFKRDIPTLQEKQGFLVSIFGCIGLFLVVFGLFSAVFQK